jgi:hypothetical protein
MGSARSKGKREDRTGENEDMRYTYFTTVGLDGRSRHLAYYNLIPTGIKAEYTTIKGPH